MVDLRTIPALDIGGVDDLSFGNRVGGWVVLERKVAIAGERPEPGGNRLRKLLGCATSCEE